MLEILLFAFLSAYLFFRLWNVLGTRTGHEKTSEPVVEAPQDNVIVMKREEDPQEDANEHLAWQATFQQMKVMDESFDVDKFVNGSKRAYKMVIEAFSNGQKELLKTLTSEGVYKSFEKAIDAREKKEQTTTIELSEDIKADIVDADLKDSIAQIGVRFSSEQLAMTMDKEGAILDNPAKLKRKHKDIWTFERDLKSDDRRWIVVGTQTG